MHLLERVSELGYVFQSILIKTRYNPFPDIFLPVVTRNHSQDVDSVRNTRIHRLKPAAFSRLTPLFPAVSLKYWLQVPLMKQNHVPTSRFQPLDRPCFLKSGALMPRLHRQKLDKKNQG